MMGYRMTSPSIPHDVEVLIKWKDLPAHETTWEPFVFNSESVPSFHLEDKVTLRARSIDKSPIDINYSRKKRHERHVTP